MSLGRAEVPHVARAALRPVTTGVGEDEGAVVGHGQPTDPAIHRQAIELLAGGRVPGPDGVIVARREQAAVGAEDHAYKTISHRNGL